MPCSTAARARDQPVEPHAVGGGADLLGVGRADGGDRGRVREPGLEEADAAEILDPVEREGLRRQLEPAEDRRPGSGPGRRGCGWSCTDGRADARSSAGRPASAPPASRGRARGRAGTRAARRRRSRRRRATAPRSAASCRASRRRRAEVGAARPVEEHGRVEHDQLEPLGRRPRAAAPGAEQRAPGVQHRGRRRAAPSPPDSRAAACASRCRAAPAPAAARRRRRRARRS